MFIFLFPLMLVHIILSESFSICINLTPDHGGPPKHVGSLIKTFLSHYTSVQSKCTIKGEKESEKYGRSKKGILSEGEGKN